MLFDYCVPITERHTHVVNAHIESSSVRRNLIAFLIGAKAAMKLAKPVLSVVATSTIVAGLLMPGHALAQQTKNTQVGVLRCNVAGGVGLILGSSKKIDCTFNRKNGTSERYVGRVGKLGLDIGVTRKSIILWAVFAPSAIEDRGALAGRYAGVSAEATIGVGVGANVLVGGRNVVTFQPLSASAQRGLNIAGGIGSIVLEPVAN